MTIIKKEIDFIEETLYSKKLKNGLEIIYIPKKGYSKQYAMFATKFGSNDLKFKNNINREVYQVPEGIAHFLEHKMFEEPEGNAFDRFAALGANVNAYTNFNITAYYFTSTDHFYENLRNLIGFVQSPYFTEDNVEKEKGIIAQEIKMYDDNPQWKVFFNLLKSLYHQYPVRNEIAGTVDSINKITKKDLYNCYNTFYHPSNMALLIVGDLDENKVFQEVETFFENHQEENENKKVEVERFYPEESNQIVKEKIEEKMPISIPLFNIGYKDKDIPLKGKNLLKKEVEIRLLIDILFGRSSSLYEKLYNEGLIDDSFGGDFTGELNYGHTIIGGESKDPLKLFQLVKSHIEQLQKTGLNIDDFHRIRRKQIGEQLAYLNSIEFIGSSFIAYYFKDINLLEYVEVLKKITFEGIENRFKEHFINNQPVISIIYPSNI